jgi:hypothetical protein
MNDFQFYLLLYWIWLVAQRGTFWMDLIIGILANLLLIMAIIEKV